MKRFFAAALIFTMVFSCTGAFALGNRTLTTEKMLGMLLDDFAGLMTSPEVSFEYVQGENRLGAALSKDMDGIPVLKGEMTADGQTLGGSISSEGIAVQTPEGRRGMHWDAIAGLFLKEMGIDGILRVSPADGEILMGILEDIAGGISEESVSSVTADTELAGIPAREHCISVDVQKLAAELDASVPRALMKNRIRLDALLKRWDTLMHQIIPGLPEDLDSSALIAAWKEIGLSEAPLEGICMDMTLAYATGNENFWKLGMTAADMSLDAAYDAEGLRIVLDPGEGNALVFDSGDIAYLAGLIAELPGCITADAISYTDEAADGLRRIAFNLNEVRLRKQLIRGAVRILSENREEINGLLDKYRPWLVYLAPEAANTTADALIMGLSVMNMNSGYSGAAALFGIPAAAGGDIRLEISYPVGGQTETDISADPSGQDSLHEGDIAETAVHRVKTEGAVRVKLSIGQNDFNLYMDDSSVEISLENAAGWNRYLRGYLNEDGKTMVCTLSQTYAGKRRYAQSLTIEAEAQHIRVRSGDGGINVNIDILEDEAVINAMISETPVTGFLRRSGNMWTLSLDAGGDALEAMLILDDGSADIQVNLSGTVFSAGVSWSDSDIAVDITAPAFTFRAEAQAQNGDVRISWERKNAYAVTQNEGGAELKDETFRMHTYRLNSKGQFAQSLSAEISWGKDDPGLNIVRSFGFSENTYDEFDLSYCPGQLVLIKGGNVIHIADVTAQGSTGQNITRISVYDAVDYANANMGEYSADPEEFCHQVELVTDNVKEHWHISLVRDGVVLAQLDIDFAPETVQPDTENVLWLTPELFRLTYGLTDAETETDDMPIQVYAGETAKSPSKAG